ncbi:MAG TPA: type II toxin-antitoxin system death-on-curing family toxin [Ktedonobacteraceae bacterium]|jgi:death-on-curing protein|nr:type II toxin-antitoxin system death-on-curing family toxin [Ktedonobacteraceae bacterium]
MSEIRYLSIADVLALHQIMMEKFGQGPAPLRNEGLLEAAIMRPRTAAYYDEADIVRQATLLLVGISQAQAFLDGNKRIAFAACDVFLRINGLVIIADPLEIALQVEAIATRTDSLNEATARVEMWLRSHVHPKTS